MVINNSRGRGKPLEPIIYKMPSESQAEENVKAKKVVEIEDEGPIVQTTPVQNNINEKELENIRIEVVKEIEATTKQRLFTEKEKLKGLNFFKRLFARKKKQAVAVKPASKIPEPAKSAPVKSAVKAPVPAETIRPAKVIKPAEPVKPATARPISKDQAPMVKPKSAKSAGLGWTYSFKKIFLVLIKAVILALVFFMAITVIGIYLAGWQGPITQQIAKYLPFPAVYIDGKFISVNEFYTDIKALEQYLDRNNVRYTPFEVRQSIIKSLIEKEVIIQLAADRQLSVSEQELSEAINSSVLKETTQEQINQLVRQLYGWDFGTYVDKVVAPLMLTKKLEENYNQTSGNLAIKERLEGYGQEIAKQPGRFEDLAMEVNEDETKAVAGDWGWIGLGDLPLAAELAVLNLKENQVSQVVETDDGYQLIKLLEKITDDKDGKPYFHVSHIYLKKRSFQQYLNEEIKKAKVITLIKI